MARQSIRAKIEITGLQETIRAFNQLPKEANNELRVQTLDLTKALAEKIRAAGMSDTPQSARAAKSVKAVRDRVPVVQAGGTKRASAVIFGSEFGATRKFGWYARGRYYDSTGKQYRPHRGRASYWFFAEIERQQPMIAATWSRTADAILRKWAS
jgi:hypothetical protein